MQKEVAAETAKLISSTPRVVLDIGCGTGFLTASICRRFVDSQVLAIDIADGMIAEAKCALQEFSNVNFKVCDIRVGLPNRNFDLVVSSSCLQWITPLAPVFNRVASCLQVGGHFVFSLMLKGTLSELQEIREGFQRSIFRFPESREVINSLETCGFKTHSFHQTIYNSKHESAWDFLRSLSNLGVSGAPEQLLSRGELRQVSSLLEKSSMSSGDGLEARYHVGYFHAIKLA